MSEESADHRDLVDRGTERADALDSYEQPTADQPDVQQMHGPIYREKAEPRDGYQPIPMWLLLPIFALLLWGGWYLGEHSGDFRPDNYEGPAAFRGSPGSPPPATMSELDRMTVGRRLYNNNCAACHQTDGQGVAGRFPPLADAEWVTGDARILSRILLHGLQGPISVRGTEYNGAMPAWGNLGDAEIAAVLSYIRNSWGNGAGEVSEALVAEVRQSVGARSEPWTAAELERIELEPAGQRPAAEEPGRSDNAPDERTKAPGDDSK
jgi:mono/diheme cytochrome c family protein